MKIQNPKWYSILKFVDIASLKYHNNVFGRYVLSSWKKSYRLDALTSSNTMIECAVTNQHCRNSWTEGESMSI